MKKHALKFTLLFLILISGCNTDLYTKKLAGDALQEDEIFPIIEGFIELSYTENDGMVFGLLSERASDAKHYILTGLTLIGILYVLYLIWRLRELSFMYHFPFFVILSGALANLIDRIRFGRVVDFIHIHWKDTLDWPFLFNVADALICFGGALLLLLLIFKKDVLERTVFASDKNE